MKIFRIIVFVSIFSALFSKNCIGQTRVYLIPTLHNLHKKNINYTYDSLKELIKKIQPDILAVEIRKTDINADSGYLKKIYPYEMWMMHYWFPDKNIEGFDWLGADIEEKPIPKNYWAEISKIKKLERALGDDSLYNSQCTECELFNTERLKILTTSSLEEILNSNDMELCLKYYECYSKKLNGTEYEYIPKFNEERNEHIRMNINKMIRKNRGKTIMVFTGDDHYVYLKDKIPHNVLYK